MRKLFLYLLCLGFLSGCGKPEPTETVIEPVTPTYEVQLSEPTAVLRTADFSTVSTTIEVRARLQLAEALSRCTTMQNHIYRFLNTPSESTQLLAQEHYRRCHQQWHIAAFYMQVPMQLSDTQALTNLNDLIDTRPFQPGYIDSVPGYPDSGLIHDIEIALNESNLRAQHRLMDEESASLGFPVIEYFLWKNPIDEYWLPKTNSVEQNIVNRRLTYLKVATDQLISQITTANHMWQSDTFQQLPQRAQRNWLVQSLQRHFMVRQLNTFFHDSLLSDASWWHPSVYAGDGKAYITGSLSELEHFLADSDERKSPFVEWLSQVPVDVSIEQIQTALDTASQRFAELPDNYPVGAEADEIWLETRQASAQLAMYFTQLARHFDLAIITQ